MKKKTTVGGGFFDLKIPSFEKEENLQTKIENNSETLTSYDIELNIPLLRFFKCFRLITTRGPTSNEIKNFLSSTLNKTEAEQNEIAAAMCVDLIKGASFNKGTDEYILANQSDDNINIIRNFNSLHRSWLVNSNSIDTFSPRGGVDVHESAEASLRYTLALFGVEAGVRYSSILGDTGGLSGALEGRRKNGPFHLGGTWGGSPHYNFYYEEADSNDDNYVARRFHSYVMMRSYALKSYEIEGETSYQFDPDGEDSVTLPWLSNPLSAPVTQTAKCNDNDCTEMHSFLEQIVHLDETKSTGCNPVENENFFLEYGDLIGVKKASECEIKYSENKSTRNDPFIFNNIDERSFNLKNHVGGGAIGSFDYWANNNTAVLTYGSKQAITHVSNEDFARRWARHVLEDFLCRETPVLNTSDAAIDYSENSYSEHTFREDGSCLACHSTLDRMSAAVRNIELYLTPASTPKRARV